MKKTIYWENGVDLLLNDFLPCVDDKTLVVLLQHLSGDQLVYDASNNGRPEETACDSQIFGVLSKLQISSNY